MIVLTSPAMHAQLVSFIFTNRLLCFLRLLTPNQPNGANCYRKRDNHRLRSSFCGADLMPDSCEVFSESGCYARMRHDVSRTDRIHAPTLEHPLHGTHV